MSNVDGRVGQTPGASPIHPFDEPVRARPLNPLRLVRELAARFRPDAEAKNLELRIEPCADGHDVVNDAAKVGWIIASLISDAIDHTASGWIRLAVSPPDGDQWHVMVEDSGTSAPLDGTDHPLHGHQPAAP